MSWPDQEPALFPESDLIILLRTDPIARFVISGVASHEVVVERLGALLHRVYVELADTPHVRVLDARGSTEVADRIASIDLEPFEGFESVAPDGFVDLAPAV
jgi:hypothetical protein